VIDPRLVGAYVQALGFNFLSALVALAGTAFALAVGSGSAVGSGLVEGFTAGGFIYISVAGVIPMMHSHRGDSVLMQMLSMLGGVAVCVAIHANGGCDGHH
jgi:zinc transporter 7